MTGINSSLEAQQAAKQFETLALQFDKTDPLVKALADRIKGLNWQNQQVEVICIDGSEKRELLFSEKGDLLVYKKTGPKEIDHSRIPLNGIQGNQPKQRYEWILLKPVSTPGNLESASSVAGIATAGMAAAGTVAESIADFGAEIVIAGADAAASIASGIVDAASGVAQVGADIATGVVDAASGMIETGAEVVGTLAIGSAALALGAATVGAAAVGTLAVGGAVVVASTVLATATAVGLAALPLIAGGALVTASVALPLLPCLFAASLLSGCCETRHPIYHRY